MNEDGVLFNDVVNKRLDLLHEHLAAGYHPDGTPRVNSTPLHMAVCHDRDRGLPYVKVLLEYGASIVWPEDGIPELHYAILNDNIQVAWLLIDYGADPYIRLPDKIHSIWDNIIAKYGSTVILPQVQMMFRLRNKHIALCATVLSVRTKSKAISRDVIGLVAEHLFSLRGKIPLEENE